MNRRIWIVACVLVVALAAGFALVRFQRPLQQSVAADAIGRAFHSHRLNIVLLGYQQDEGNSDTVVFAHLDVDRHTATLVSVPRDAWVAIPGHGHGKINAAIGYGGPRLTGRIVSQLFDAPVDATIAVAPAGAKQLVDALGGLNVDVERDMDYDDNAGNLHIHLKRGEQYLTGGQVLEYLRFRHDAESDWGRVRRQQHVLKDLLDTLSQPQNWTKVPHLLDLARNDVQTTLTQEQLFALLQAYRGVADEDVRTLTAPGRGTYVGDASVVALDERWTHLFGRLLFGKSDPPQDPVLVANATGVDRWNETVVGALRGGGWNVATFVDEPVRAATSVSGTRRTGGLIAAIFGETLHAAKTTTLVVGSDFAPRKE